MKTNLYTVVGDRFKMCLVGSGFMVFNATFNNISVYPGSHFCWWRKPPTCHKSQTLSGAGYELTTSVVIGTDCINSCKSNYLYHMSMAFCVPLYLLGSMSRAFHVPYTAFHAP